MRSARWTVASRWAITIAVRPARSRSTARSSRRSVAGSSRRGRLVQDDQAGVLEEDAGEGEQLGLAGREAAAAGREAVSRPSGRSVEPGAEPEVAQDGPDARVGDGGVEEIDAFCQALQRLQRCLFLLKIRFELRHDLRPAERFGHFDQALIGGNLVASFVFCAAPRL